MILIRSQAAAPLNLLTEMLQGCRIEFKFELCRETTEQIVCAIFDILVVNLICGACHICPIRLGSYSPVLILQFKTAAERR